MTGAAGCFWSWLLPSPGAHHGECTALHRSRTPNGANIARHRVGSDQPVRGEPGHGTGETLLLCWHPGFVFLGSPRLTCPAGAARPVGPHASHSHAHARDPAELSGSGLTSKGGFAEAARTPSGNGFASQAPRADGQAIRTGT